jgi:glycine cleavage system pyridoxal-binding protein P
MRYISNTPAQQKEMLGLIGVSSIEDLQVRIPAKVRLSRPLNLPREAESTPQVIHDAPVTTPMRRLDQTLAARQPRLRWTP